jgi:hypothetical protein
VDSGAWRPVPTPPSHPQTHSQPSYSQPAQAQPAHAWSADGQSPAGAAQQPERSGDAALQAADEAVAALEGLAELPVTEHVARFDLAHAALTEALASIDKV